MPTYDYICDSCGHEFEAYESIMAPARTECPECKLPKLRRKIGPGAAILFKGSGFYQTDYRSDSYKKAAEADKSSSEPAKPAAESKSSTESSSTSKSEPAKAGPDPSRRANHDQGTLPNLFQIVRDRLDRRPAFVSLLLPTVAGSSTWADGSMERTRSPGRRYPRNSKTIRMSRPSKTTTDSTIVGRIDDPSHDEKEEN